MTSVRITQTRSTIGQTKKHRGTIRSLGLGRIGKTVEHTVDTALEGKLRHVAHLVTVEPLDASRNKKANAKDD